VLSCWDRILLFGTLPKICFAEGMTSYLYERKIRIFDYAKFAEPFRNTLRGNAERLAGEYGIEVEFLRKRNVRKEDRVKAVLAQRGDHPGLVCILSAMEACSTYKPWHNKNTGRTYLLPDDGKCLHYYFYFIDEELGLGYVRVPTWLPCRLPVYFNGHSWLASVLRKRKIDFRLIDNAFVEIGDWRRAQQIADELEVRRLHHRLDEMARRFCPIHREFGVAYHWSVDQCEYATDVVFRRQADLAVIYGNLTRTAIHTVKPDHIANTKDYQPRRFPTRRTHCRCSVFRDQTAGSIISNGIKAITLSCAGSEALTPSFRNTTPRLPSGPPSGIRHSLPRGGRDTAK
jgi:hypothetical protein